MDRLTAYRNFARPGYCPVRKTKVFANRWYVCTFQNLERGMDYLGLGEGEYTELLPGNKARQARDAHLNHLNGLREYTGPFYAVTDPHRCNSQSFYPSLAAAQKYVDTITQRNAADLDRALQYLDKQIARTDEDIDKSYSKCSDWHGPAAWRAELEQSRQRNISSYSRRATIERLR